jgi:hypothetical protein
MKKKAPLKEKAKGIEWTFQCQSPGVYVRAHGKDSAGITYPGDREVFFNSAYFTPDYVRHEIMHVFAASTSTSSMLKSADDAEELCAQLYGEHGPEMDLLVDKILEYFLR